jgi:hypothetical protein
MGEEHVSDIQIELEEVAFGNTRVRPKNFAKIG